MTLATTLLRQALGTDHWAKEELDVNRSSSGVITRMLIRMSVDLHSQE